MGLTLKKIKIVDMELTKVRAVRAWHTMMMPSDLRV